MTNEQAKLLLQAYRPGGQDAQDTLYAEALEQVRRDPELARWFEVEQRLDAAIGRKLRELPVPPALKHNILAAELMTRSEPWWRRRGIGLAAAAAAAVLLAGAAMWLQSQGAPQFAAYRDEMIQRALKDPDHLTFASRDLASIRQWLQAREVDAAFDLPARLRGLTPHGCRIVDWNGERIVLICLVPEGKSHVDLFVIDRTRFRDFTPSAGPQFGRSGALTTAVWRKGNKTYLLAGKLDEDQLSRFL